MTAKKDIIFVSSEDDKHLVKGGIGTYLGIFTRVLAKEHPEFNITWISQSPNNTEFEEQDGNVRRIYLPQVNQDLSLYSKSVEKRVREIAEEKLAAGRQVIIESPEWEGLLFDLYQTLHHKNLLKVTRVHTPLAVTAVLNKIQIGSKETEQMSHEKSQILSSDLISCPTDYVWKATLSEVFSGKAVKIERAKIPNCIDTTTFRPDIQSRQKALDDFAALTGQEMNADNFNIFVIGSVEKRKGSDLVAKMAEEVIKKIPNAHFYFIGHHNPGDGTELTANKKMSVETLRSQLSPAANKNVHFTGYVPHDRLPGIMPAGDLFVISYLGDNFPGVVAEIGLSKRPLLALLRGGVNEMLETPEGYAALVMQSDRDADIITQGIAQIVAHHKDPSIGLHHAEQLYEKLIKEYGESKVVQQLISTYSKSLDRKRHERHPPIR